MWTCSNGKDCTPVQNACPPCCTFPKTVIFYKSPVDEEETIMSSLLSNISGLLQLAHMTDGCGQGACCWGLCMCICARRGSRMAWFTILLQIKQIVLDAFTVSDGKSARNQLISYCSLFLNRFCIFQKISLHQTCIRMWLSSIVPVHKFDVRKKHRK